MFAVPVATPVDRPEELTVATLGADDDHVTEVNNWVLPSSKVPVAVNCSRVPAAMELVVGETEIPVRCAATTVRVAVSVNVPIFA
jgi:hypothetical protein